MILTPAKFLKNCNVKRASRGRIFPKKPILGLGGARSGTHSPRVLFSVLRLDDSGLLTPVVKSTSGRAQSPPRDPGHARDDAATLCHTVPPVSEWQERRGAMRPR